MEEPTKVIQLFKPSGEPIPISAEDVSRIGTHPDMGGTVFFMDDGKIIHTNLPFMMVSSQEEIEDLAGAVPDEEVK